MSQHKWKKLDGATQRTLQPQLEGVVAAETRGSLELTAYQLSSRVERGPVSRDYSREWWSGMTHWLPCLHTHGHAKIKKMQILVK